MGKRKTLCHVLAPFQGLVEHTRMGGRVRQRFRHRTARQIKQESSASRRCIKFQCRHESGREDQVDSVWHKRESNLRIDTRSANGRHVKQSHIAAECGFRLANRTVSWHLKRNLRSGESERWDGRNGHGRRIERDQTRKGKKPPKRSFVTWQS